MKTAKIIIHQPFINKLIGRELNLTLHENANLIDALMQVDETIKSKGNFPVPDYKSLVHMVYNPIENRFYKQVAITAYKQSGEMLNVRENPEKEILDGITIILMPAGGCISEWEEAINHEEFLEALKHLRSHAC
jgi:hypothetical protein